MKNLKLIYSSSLAAMGSIGFTTIITVWAEQSKGLKDWLKALTGHHWTSKSIFAIVLYLVLFMIVMMATREPSAEKTKRGVNVLMLTTFVGVIVLLGFFVWHAMQ